MKILLILITISFTQIPLYKDTYNWEANMLNVTYIEQYIDPKYSDCFSLINHKEQSLLISMNKLLIEITENKHPEWRAKQIVHTVKDYVKLKKDSEDRLDYLLKEMKRLGRF